VTPPDFHNLVGEEGTPQELERLRRVHDLLVSAGPPPELPRSLARAPRTGARIFAFPATRPRLAAALAAAAMVAVGIGFGIGYSVGGSGGFPAKFTRPMHGTAQAARASALIDVAARDPNGNWPLRLTVRGLKPLPKGSWYILYLTKGGKPVESCGFFNVSSSVTRVKMSVPYDLRDFGKLYDGWDVRAHTRGEARDREQVLLTT
jgi:hypothetical protein